MTTHNKDTFRRAFGGGATVFHCDACGRRTRRTDQGNQSLCPECDERTMQENGLSDSAEHYRQHPEEKAATEALIRRLAEKAAAKGGDRARLGLDDAPGESS